MKCLGFGCCVLGGSERAVGRGILRSLPRLVAREGRLESRHVRSLMTIIKNCLQMIVDEVFYSNGLSDDDDDDNSDQ